MESWSTKVTVMHVIRPVQLADIEDLLDLAQQTSFGLTTLPVNRNLLEKRVKHSLKSFQNLDGESPGTESYLFVMQNLQSGKVCGTTGITAKVGGFEPFYAYRIQTSTHDSRMLDVRKEIPVLHLQEDHNGPTEIGSLFLDPAARQPGNGRTLSLSRFLFMADYPKMFERTVLAEMRGVIDEQGRSPFWDAVGKHFFEIDFPKADYLSIVNKEFIGDLMPRYPLYIPLLPQDAQAVIGQVHEQTRPARKLLESEGFQFRNFVDIFEAGPMLHCEREHIRSDRDSRVQQVSSIIDSHTNESTNKTQWIISSKKPEYRVCQGGLNLGNSGVELTQDVASALGISVGDNVRFVPLYPDRAD